MPDVREPLPGEPILPDDPYFELIEAFGFTGPLAICKGCGGVTLTVMTQSGDAPWLRHFRTCVPLRFKFGLPELPGERARPANELRGLEQLREEDPEFLRG